MIRTLKGLGLAFIAVLAMSALGSTAANASVEFTCSAYPCSATGSTTLGSEQLTTEAGLIRCAGHFVVEKQGGGDLTGQATAVTLTANYDAAPESCKAFGFLSATVDTMSCDYVFHPTEKVSAGVYKHHVDVNCTTAGDAITISASTCKASVPAQTGLTTVKTTNLADGSVTVQPELFGITLNVTQDGIGCPFSGTGHKTAAYHGDLVLSRIGGGTVSVSGE